MTTKTSETTVTSQAGREAMPKAGAKRIKLSKEAKSVLGTMSASISSIDGAGQNTAIVGATAPTITQGTRTMADDRAAASLELPTSLLKDEPEQQSGREMRTKANSLLIVYPRLKALEEDIQLCWETSQYACEPHCMSLEGATGTGKTTLVKRFAATYPRLETPSGTEVPVLYILTHSPTTEKGLASLMLHRLGDPAADRGTLYSLNMRLINLLISCRVKLVILDDIHNLMYADTDRRRASISNWLKVLIKESRVPFLVVGIEGKVEPLLIGNPELSRLFAARESLYPFTWNTANSASVKEFARFVKIVEDRIGMQIGTSLSRIDLLGYIHRATGGVVANVMNLLRYAQLLAVKRGSSSIEVKDLQNAYTKRLGKHMHPYGEANPFTDTDDTLRKSPRSKSQVVPAHGSTQRYKRDRTQRSSSLKGT
jgi:hypothetical protein